MRREHFAAFAPHCPVCARDRAIRPPLVLATVVAEAGADVLAGMLHCSEPACQHEYPIIDGIPIIMANLRQHLSERAVELLLRDDLPAELWGAIGDALGPDTWFDAIRQVVSTYAWDGYADLDPAEPLGETKPGETTLGEMRPGAASACLAQLLAMTPAAGACDRLLDLGCAAGRTSFDLARYAPGGLVLGVDSNLALLRLARRVATDGEARYALRRSGIAYDEKRFAADLPGRDRVDFWACDAMALPFAPGVADLAAALNLLDCVASPIGLLGGLASVLRPGGMLLLSTPFDWSTRATPIENWIGGHSQRGAFAGSGAAFLQALLTPGAHAQSIAGLSLRATADRAWQTRLHDRASVTYRTFLAVASKLAAKKCF